MYKSARATGIIGDLSKRALVEVSKDVDAAEDPTDHLTGPINIDPRNATFVAAIMMYLRVQTTSRTRRRNRWQKK